MDIVFDIGGTTTRIAVSEKNEKLSPVVYPTPKDYKQAIEKFGEVVFSLASKNIEGVAGGIAGVIDEKGRVLRSKNLLAFEGKFFARDLSKKLGVPVFAENDCTMAGLGEIGNGNSGDARVVAYVTISTGVGAKRFVDGKGDESRLNFEPGKQFIDIQKGEPVTFEDLVSGSSILARYKKRPSEIHDVKFWKEQAKLIAIGLNNMLVFWRPDVIILGGGVVLLTDLKISEIEGELKKYLKIYKNIPKIKKARLGDYSGLYGAREFLKMKRKK